MASNHNVVAAGPDDNEGWEFELWRRAIDQQDKDAQEKLYELYKPKFTASLRKRSSLDDVAIEDVIHMTFVTLLSKSKDGTFSTFKKTKELDGTIGNSDYTLAGVRHYVWVCLREQASKYFRQQNPASSLSDEQVDPPATETAFEDSATRADYVSRAEKAGLTSTEADSVWQNSVDGTPPRELARHLGLKRQEVYNHLNNGRRKLRKHWGDDNTQRESGEN